MFKKIIIFLFLGFILVGAPLQAQMATGNFGLDETALNAQYKGPGNPPPPAALFDNINKIVSALLGITSIVFFGLITFGGIRWMTAQGNQEFVEKAKGTIEAAVIGLLIVAAAYAITNFIFTKLAETAPAAPPSLPAPQADCTLIKVEADCAYGCQWVRTPVQPDGSTGKCQTAPASSGGWCDQFTLETQCVAGGCSWNNNSCVESVSGICLRVIGTQLYCAVMTDADCAKYGPSYTFYANKNAADCASQQATYQPLPAPGSCVDQGNKCVDTDAIATSCPKVVSFPGCSTNQVCCTQ